MAKKYRKKPVEIEAVRFIMDRETPATDFLGLTNEYRRGRDMFWENDNAIFEMFQPEICSLKIKTLEGLMNVSDGDYIIKGVYGEFYPCKPDIFKKTYEEIKFNI